MKDVMFKNIKTGDVISGYNFMINTLKEFWKEAKELDCIPRDSADYDKFKAPEREVVLDYVKDYFEDSDEYVQVNKLTTPFVKKSSKAKK